MLVKQGAAAMAALIEDENGNLDIPRAPRDISRRAIFVEAIAEIDLDSGPIRADPFEDIDDLLICLRLVGGPIDNLVFDDIPIEQGLDSGFHIIFYAFSHVSICFDAVFVEHFTFVAYECMYPSRSTPT